MVTFKDRLMNSKAGKPSDIGLHKICPMNRIQTARAGGPFFLLSKSESKFRKKYGQFFF